MPQPSTAGYTNFAKVLHWLIAVILVIQFTIGLIMPKVRRGMEPGLGMRVHISIGIVVLVLMSVRLLWRVAHKVPAQPSLPAWQRKASEAVHWLLYLVVFVTTFTGWFYASARGWSLTFFGLFPLPGLVAHGSPTGRALGEIHESIVWVLLALVVVHVAAALVHAFVYRDQVMQRMLFEPPPAPGRAMR
jgi:cytochrome b561